MIDALGTTWFQIAESEIDRRRSFKLKFLGKVVPFLFNHVLSVWGQTAGVLWLPPTWVVAGKNDTQWEEQRRCLEKGNLNHTWVISLSSSITSTSYTVWSDNPVMDWTVLSKSSCAWSRHTLRKVSKFEGGHKCGYWSNIIGILV